VSEDLDTSKGFECRAYHYCTRMGTARGGCATLTKHSPYLPNDTPMESEIKDIRQQLILIEACLSSIVLLLESQLSK
jgi:hypothetical protein